VSDNRDAEPLGGEPACLSPWICVWCGRVIEDGSRHHITRQPSVPDAPIEVVGPFHEVCVNEWLAEHGPGACV
jgi:hypothetical protein